MSMKDKKTVGKATRAVLRLRLCAAVVLVGICTLLAVQVRALRGNDEDILPVFKDTQQDEIIIDATPHPDEIMIEQVENESSHGGMGNGTVLGQNKVPTVLIYHTHTTEAYTPTERFDYEETTRWRTDDNERNIVAVGEELARILWEDYGIYAIHDSTNHEPPKLSSSYSRSVKTMEMYREKYPSIELYIDVHRDAYNTSGDRENTDYAVICGERVARMMFVVGTGEGATGAGFGEMPDFESNYALAKRITEKLKKVDEGLVREIRVKKSRYNQHISDKCLFVEVGHNANTLEEALAAVKYLAAAIYECAAANEVMELVP